MIRPNGIPAAGGGISWWNCYLAVRGIIGQVFALFLATIGSDIRKVFGKSLKNRHNAGFDTLSMLVYLKVSIG